MDYKIKIHYYPLEENEPIIEEISTEDIEWTMCQYGRNRQPFEWELLK
jgi:hypothetical protein